MHIRHESPVGCVAKLAQTNDVQEMESIAAKWVSGNGLRMIRQIERQVFVDGNV